MLLHLIWCHNGWFCVIFVRLIHSCQSVVLIFFSISAGIPVSISISRKSLPVFSYSICIISQCSISGGVGALCGYGIGDGLVLCLAVGKVGGYWLWQVGEGGEVGCYLLVFGEGGGPGGGVGVLLIPFINYFQYLSSKARCDHNFNDTYQSTVGTMSTMFYTRVSCWSEVHPRLAVYCCIVMLVTSLGVVHQSCELLLRQR